MCKQKMDFSCCADVPSFRRPGHICWNAKILYICLGPSLHVCVLVHYITCLCMCVHATMLYASVSTCVYVINLQGY